MFHNCVEFVLHAGREVALPSAEVDVQKGSAQGTVLCKGKCQVGNRSIQGSGIS
jgi:hypothetical protein